MQKIQELDDQNNGEWNKELVQAIFLSIPLSKVAPEENKLIWRHSLNGVFSVKIAYHDELDRKKKLSEETSKEKDKDERWMSIWALKIPGMVTMF